MTDDDVEVGDTLDIAGDDYEVVEVSDDLVIAIPSDESGEEED